MKIMLSKIYNKPGFWFILFGVYFALAGTGVWLIMSMPHNEIIRGLEKTVPWVLRMNVLLLIAAVSVCRRELWNFVKIFFNRRGVLIAGLCITAFCMTAFTVPRTHRIFYDEDIYANVGQNIALDGRAGQCNYGTFEYGEYYPHWITYNKQPSGWPFLISLVFQMLGTNELYGFLLNNFIFSSAVLTVFLIAWHLSKAFFTSFISALIFGLIPHNLIWHNTIAAEPSSALFAGLTVLALVIYAKTRRQRHLVVLSFLIPLTCQMRPESILIAAWTVPALLWLAPGTFVEKKSWITGIPALAFLLPHLIHLYIMRGMSWGADGDKISLNFLAQNIFTNGVYYFNNKFFPVIFILFAIIGLLFTRRWLKEKLLVLLWFLIFWGIFLFFYAGSYTYGADVRFALLGFMPLAVLAGLGCGYARDRLVFSGLLAGEKGRTKLFSFLLIGIILASFLQFFPLVRRIGQEAWGARYDHQYAEEFSKKIPERSIVLTHNPAMFLLWNRNAIQTYAGINNPEIIGHLMKKYRGHVYFHYNYWCNAESAPSRKLCRAIKDQYFLEEIACEREQNYEYVLYKMEMKR